MNLVLNAAPVFKVNAANGSVSISAKIADIYRGKEHFKVFVIYATSYRTVQYRITCKGYTGYEPFIQKWVERFKSVNPIWESDLKRNVIEPKRSIIDTFSKWATVSVINDHDHDLFKINSHASSRRNARASLWNKRLIPYMGLGYFQSC